MATAQKVKMEMGNRFAPVRAVVDHEPVSGLLQFHLSGDFLGRSEEVAEHGMVLQGDGRMAGMVLFGDEENVDRGLGGDIAERQHVVVLVDNVGVGFAVDDPFEDRFGHGPSFPTKSSGRAAGDQSGGRGRG